jgi:hypothetical protein
MCCGRTRGIEENLSHFGVVALWGGGLSLIRCRLWWFVHLGLAIGRSSTLHFCRGRTVVYVWWTLAMLFFPQFVLLLVFHLVLSHPKSGVLGGHCKVYRGGGSRALGPGRGVE